MPVPIYLAAMTSPKVELAGELADGVMPFMWSAAHVSQSKAWAARGRAKAPGRAPLDGAVGLPTFVADDIEEMRARANLALFTTFPFYQRMRQRLRRRGDEGGTGRRRRLAERPPA